MPRLMSRSFLYIVIAVLTFIIAIALPLGSPAQEGKEDPQACCFPDGSCEDCDPEKCTAKGGTPQGYGTCCDCTECPQITQACCFPDGNCEDLDPEICSSQGGEPQGSGTDCAHTSCPQPTQACCFPNGSCQDLQTGTCLDMGGTPQGEGTNCHSTDCPQPTQACCFHDGSCKDLDVASCTSEGGDPQGSGTDCADTSCPQPTQACCFTDGSCSNLDVESCTSQGGTPQGEGTDCSPNPCPQPTQACCFDDGSCRNLDVKSCASQGGEPQGEGTDCFPNPCPQPTQACCFTDGSCQDLVSRTCRAQGGVSQGTGTCCSRTTCPQPEVSPAPLLPIRLISPLPGEGLGLPSTAIQFCWESLGIAGLTYEVFHHTKQCDPDVINGPHPFAPLIPDPTLEAEQRARKDSLYREQGTSQQRLNYLAEFCQRHLAQLKKMSERTNDKPSKLEQLRALKKQLEEGREAAEAVDHADAFTPEFADSCSKTLEEILSPYPASFDDLTPCVADACNEFARRLTGITSMLQSLDANATCESIVFNSLLERWEEGTKHRDTFKFYYDLYNGIAGSIAFITDILGNLTPDAEQALRTQIDTFLSGLDPNVDPRKSIETAKTVHEKLEMIQGFLAKGGPSPAFLVGMVQAMAEQAAAAAAVAVKGWARFAQAMASAFDKAYQSVLCDLKVLEWLISQQARIQAFCEACQHCLRDEITTIDAELEEIAAEEQAAATARQVYWQEQQLVISAQISQVRLTNEWLDACCRPGIQTIQIPSESPCAEQLEDALKEALGDKACFLTFSCTIKCKYKNGQPVEATVECEHSFPLAERRVCCCVPCERQQSSLGSQPDPGRPGGTVCHPPEGGVTVPEPGGWGVEGRDESGNLVASSSRRELGRGGITEPSPLRPGPIPPGGCLCSISASVNGIPITPGGFALTMQQGVMVNIDAIGDCRPDPDCGTGVQSISIQPPITAPAWLPNPIAMIPLPITVPAASVAYDFPNEGTYTITVSQFCRDGQKCSYTFTVDASGPPNPVPRQPRPEEEFEPGYCPSCGSDKCLELTYRRDEKQSFMPLYEQHLMLNEPGWLELELSSECRTDCPSVRNVRWEMSEPDGSFVVQEDVNLYTIEYSFTQIGEYLLCVIETVPCPEGELRFENWWIFEVESSD